MRRLLRVLAGSAFIALLLPAVASAQATITGTVKDASGAVLPGVTVEASSPALIEKVRTATTDGTGQYRIENLAPGTYAVTFTLSGFSSVKREGIELVGSFVASINVDLKVGSLEETITVSGQTPIVDLQNVARERVINEEAMNSLPVNRMPAFLASSTPGVNNGTVDVGGNTGSPVTGAALTVHGSRSTDLLTLSNGLSLQSVQTGSAVQGVANMAVYQEITLDVAAGDASQMLGGVRMNMIPATGGNTVRGSFLGAYSSEGWQGSNFDSNLQTRGLPTPNKINKLWDINPAIGGPIKKDKLWYFATGRYNGAWNYSGTFGNANAGKPDVWTFAPDTNRQFTQLNTREIDGRVTLQATQKHKVSVGYNLTAQCQCNNVSATTANDAATHTYYSPKHVVQVDYSAPLTNRVLLDGSILYYNLYRIGDPANSQSLIQVTDQSNTLTYRAENNDNRNISKQMEYRAALAYVTGAHSFKVGFNNMQASSSMFTYAISPPITYRVNTVAGVTTANQFTEYALPSIANSNIDADLGIFGQDRFSWRRLSVAGGLRFDYFASSFPQMYLGPTLYAPNRNILTPATDGVSWKDISPRSGLAVDLFGNGKTSLKVSANRYVAGQALRGSGSTTLFGSSLTPTNLLVTSVSRNWTDQNKDFVINCDPANPAQQDLRAAGGDFCGAGNATFATNQPGSAYDPAVLTGWGKRAYNWEFTTGVQQEITPRLAVEVSYFRRVFGNFPVVNNLAAPASAYNTFTVTVPTDSRLPNGGGYTVTGININTTQFNQVNNFVTSADNYGGETEHWNGVDATFNLRPSAALFFSGGLSTGRTTLDTCALGKNVPSTLFGLTTLGSTNNASTLIPAAFCHMQEPWLSQVKVTGSYTVPKVDVQLGLQFQSVPGPQILANYTATSASIATQNGGYTLSGGAANQVISIVAPGSMYGDRRNQLDVRLAKVLRINRTRLTAGVDIANALNANPVLTQQTAYATWLTPQSILTARFFKLSLQMNF